MLWFWRHTGSSTFCSHCFMDSHQTLGHIHLEVEEILDVFGLDIGPLGVQPVLQSAVDHSHVKSMCDHSQGPLFRPNFCTVQTDKLIKQVNATHCFIV